MHGGFDHLGRTGKQGGDQSWSYHRHQGHEGTNPEVHPRADLEGLAHTSHSMRPIVIAYYWLHPLGNPKHEHKAHKSCAIDDAVSPHGAVCH